MTAGPQLLQIAAVAGAAAVASVAGGLAALWRTPTTLFISIVLGFAGGVLLGTIAFEMLPSAAELGSVPIAVGGFVPGFVSVYALDLFVHRGRLAGPKSAQREAVERFHRRRRPRGTEVTVLAGGTSVEELIEGLSIGVGAVLEPGLGLLIAAAIALDNFSEGLSIGALLRREAGTAARPARRILGWTGLIGVAVLGSALVGAWLLEDIARPLLAFLLAAGAGGMFYLTITDLLPEAEEHHYEQSAAIACAAGFALIFVLAAMSDSG